MNELRDRKIRVNAVSPGAILTEVCEKGLGAEAGAAYAVDGGQTQIYAGHN